MISVSESEVAPAGDVAESHISTVFFAGDRAYKLLKPIRTHFLDYSTTARRLEAVDREIAVNREIAPDVYLGSADVVEHGAVVDRFLVMRRLPPDRRLTALIGRSSFEERTGLGDGIREDEATGLYDEIRKIARSVAAYHASKPAILDAHHIAGAQAVRQNWEDNFQDMAPLVGVVVDAAEVARTRELALRFLDHQERLFDRRISEGLVRECHGDLTAEDIFCLTDGPRIIDALAFSDRLRISDVLADICFLAMDLDRLAGSAASRHLMRCYSEFSNEHHPATLAHHYVAYRAHVRAKVAGIRYRQGERTAGALMRSYHRLALDHLERARIQLVLVGGSPGTGKTTVATGMAEKLEFLVLNTDELRKDLVGRGHEDHDFSEPDKGIYAPHIGEKTYATLFERAESLLATGESVILDASWNTEAHRSAARSLAEMHGAEIVEIECMLPPGLAKERIALRLQKGGDASDARPELVDTLRQRQEPWVSAHGLDTSGEPEDAIALALSYVCASAR